ncbi:MAG: ABC transporter permease [Clostridia bacterium]|nr:ABC transporter permease [Clostridia bacterium]
MTPIYSLTVRNIKLFFKDKGMFFTALITPMILLVLYITFLANVYEDSFVSLLAEFGFTASKSVMGGCVGGQLFSSLLSVSPITVAFCSNMLMVQDKVTGAYKDLTVTPVKTASMALSYYVASFASTLLICLVATAACFLYLGKVGWFFSVSDILFVLLDVLILVLFGTALSAAVNVFLSSQGQISAVGSIVSACYGFICGAYMPISSFAEGLQKVLSFLPGTYGTSLMRNHALQGVFDQLKTDGLPQEGITALRDLLDCNVYFFDHTVPVYGMYIILGGFTLAFLLIYVLVTLLQIKKTNK